jgi:hypothetical protein
MLHIVRTRGWTLALDLALHVRAIVMARTPISEKELAFIEIRDDHTHMILDVE